MCAKLQKMQKIFVDNFPSLLTFNWKLSCVTMTHHINVTLSEKILKESIRPAKFISSIHIWNHDIATFKY